MDFQIIEILGNSRCEICRGEYGETAPDVHSPSIKMYTNETHHWNKCIDCGSELNKGEHTGEATCVSKAYCYTCGIEHGELDEDGHVVADKLTSDANVHYKECENGCGAQFEVAGHSGGTATCESKAKCSECGTEYGEYAAHRYSSEWKTYGSKHWHECACGARSDEAEHEYGEWVEVTKPTATAKGVKESACVCGAKLTDEIPYVLVLSIKLLHRNFKDVLIVNLTGHRR